MKLGTIFALVVGIFCVLPDLQMPALTRFIDGSGLVFAGKLFPFCFITIACGAISGFHTLIASGTTPKILTRESYVRPVGYGAMCLESLVAIMALVAACTLDPGVYLSMNVKGEPAAVIQKVSAAGYPVSMETMTTLADEVGEKTLFNRTAGAATLAVGMAQIFAKVTHGRWLDLWYHFAIMFEALFILTTLDAGTRVGRYILQDALGHFWKPLGNTKALGPNLLASALMVAGWGYFLIQGVRDPLGGINSLWPLFGIANQMLAAIALCLGTTIILKMVLADGHREKAKSQKRISFALVTLVPLVWLLAVTFTAGIQKVWHSDPRIGFLSAAKGAKEKIDEYKRLQHLAVSDRNPSPSDPTVAEQAALLTKAKAELPKNRALYFNNHLDAGVAIMFLVLVSIIVLISVREWMLLLSRRKAAVLHESEPVWLPDYAIKEPGANLRTAAGAAAIAFGLAKELSGETQFERARQEICHCEKPSDQKVFQQVTEERFNGVRRCC
jgi:carbon starvation protein